VSLLRIDSSILGEHSSSRALADTVVDNWTSEHPGATVVERDLAATPVEFGTWTGAASFGHTPAELQTDAQKAAHAEAQALLAELTSAETIVIATGLYNWGVNGLLKTWIDTLLAVAPYREQILAGKDVALVIARGGYYGEDGPQAGWDHGTPYLVRIFAEVWGADVTLVERDFTLVGQNPALDQFKEQGAALKAAAEAKADATGKQLAAAFAERKAS
jgi:FMN-dependent NADH-azoreductase